MTGQLRTNQPRRDARKARAPRPRPRAAVELTHPDKKLFPDPGITKRQLAEYWEGVADFALPLMRQRPLTLYRCPNGYAAQCFYQKHVGAGMPEAVARVDVGGGEIYAMVDDRPALLGLVQIGALELHVWGSRVPHLEQPDIVVFDLDPAEGVEWRDVVAGAARVRARVEELGLRPFVRLTGGKGLHVVVPVIPGPRWPAVKKFARTLVDDLVSAEPARFTASMAKSKRTGKIFIDYLRNAREATAIAAYSPRARPGAPVALPIDWDELDPRASSPPRFGVLDVPGVIRGRGVDPWKDFEAARKPLG